MSRLASLGFLTSIPFTFKRTCPNSTPAARAEDPSTINATTGRSSRVFTNERSVCKKSESVNSCGLKNMTPKVGVKILASYHSPPGGSSPSLCSDVPLWGTSASSPNSPPPPEGAVLGTGAGPSPALPNPISAHGSPPSAAASICP